LLHFEATFHQMAATHVQKACHCTRLQTANLNGVWNLTDEALFALAQHCPNLHNLQLSNCDKVTDAGVIAIGTIFFSLPTAFCPV
jgi:hypothetical protein